MLHSIPYMCEHTVSTHTAALYLVQNLIVSLSGPYFQSNIFLYITLARIGPVTFELFGAQLLAVFRNSRLQL